MATLASSPRSTTITLASPSAGPFNVNFRLFDAVTLAVYVDGARVTTGWTLAATFSAGFTDAATITFSDPLPAGTVLQIDGDQRLVRGLDYSAADPSLTARLNIEFPRLWAGLQEAKREAGRSIRGLEAIAPMTEMPGDGQTLIWSDDAGGFVPGPIDASLTDYPNRAALFSAISGGLVPLPGVTYRAAGLAYLGQTGATVIPDLPGLVPDSDVTPDHWATNTTPGATDMTAAIRAAFDYAMVLIRSVPRTGAEIIFGPQVYLASNELLSDDFQAKWWAQTGLLKGKFITVRGAPAGATEIRVSTSWLSGVRNAANGNLRTYGPWENQPSPSCLFPVMANKNGAAPAAFSIQDIRMRGTDRHGRDPIPFLAMNELDANHSGLHIVQFGAWGEVVLGAFNSHRSNIHVESCGFQPTQCGVVFAGDAAGFVTPQVLFDYNHTTGVLTARAATAFGPYAAGATVPFFRSAHVGRQFVVQQGAVVGSTAQPVKLAITAVASDGTPTATTTRVGPSVTGRTATNLAGSFLPVVATTTAGSAVVTLNAPIRFGRGAADMVGALVAIPKAGSTAPLGAQFDLLVSRIVSCDVGSDGNGYTQVTLARPARFAVSEDFITSSAHACFYEDSNLAGDLSWRVDDTDWIACRWENSGGFVADATAGSYQFLSQNAGESVQYVACKVHGANPILGSFAADGQVIFDNADGINLIGFDLTHMAFKATGSLRFMGARGGLSATGIQFGGWQLPHDFRAVYLDPQAGYSAAQWRIDLQSPAVKNDAFPVLAQGFWGKTAALTNIERHRLTYRSDDLLGFGTVLDSTDDLNNVNIAGVYTWGAPAPANAPGFPTFGVLHVARGQFDVSQRLTDLDNQWTFEREFFSLAWTPWRLLTLRSAANTAMLDDANDINTIGKHTGQQVRNTTDGKLYVSTGALATSPWVSADGATTLTPV